MTRCPQRSPVDRLVAQRLALPMNFSRKELQQAQYRCLHASLCHALSSSFYRQRFANVMPEHITTLEDLQQLPLLSAEEIRSDGHRMLCVSQSQVSRMMTLSTSGSTGAPKRFAFTAKDLMAITDFFYQGMLSLVDVHDRVLVLLPFMQPASTGHLLLDALHKGGITAAGLWPPRPGEVVDHIITKKMTCLVGLPQHLLEASTHLPVATVRTMLLCSDYAPPALRQRIEKNCGCKTFLHYGATESGLGGAVECACHDGCHIRESDLLLEIIDPLTGRQLKDGQSGEIVLTTLGREAMGLFRYRTGDMAVLNTNICDCGGVTARLQDIQGKMDACKLRSGHLLRSQDIDDVVFAIDGVLDYRAHLLSGTPDILHLHYQAVPGGVDLTTPLLDALGRVVVIAQAMTCGALDTRVTPATFTADHLRKRTIEDKRLNG